MKRLQVLVAVLLIGLLAGGVAFAQSGYDLFQKALAKERAEGKMEEAIQLYKQIVREHASDRTLAAKALVQMGQCYEKLGNVEAQKAYERVVREYSDQPEAATARARLAALTEPSLAVPASAVLTRRLTDDANLDALGTPSADGRFLSTTDWGTGDVALIDTATGQKRRLTNKGSWAENPIEMAEFTAVSPEGKRIVYGWLNKSKRYELRVIDMEGKSPRVLCSSEELPGNWPRPTAWTPDGNWILVFIGRSGGTDQLALISAADGKARILKTLPFGTKTNKASISPDGRYVVYAYPSKEDSPQRDIFLLSIEDSREMALVGHAADDFSPLWAPDGQSVVFVSDRTGSLGLWKIRVAGGKPQGPEELLRLDVGNLDPIGFSAKGSFFYGFSSGLVDVYQATLDLATGKVTAAPAPVSQRYTGGRAGPHWSPDGKSLVYISTRGPFSPMLGFHTLSIFSPETGRERELPLNLRSIVRYRWSPDAREILITAADTQGRKGLFRVDARTGEATPVVLAEAGTALRYSSWSPDGKSVFFVRWDWEKQVNTIVERKLQSGEEKELGRYTLADAYVAGFDLSPDGQQILLYLTATSTFSGTFKVFPVAGGQPRDLYRIESNPYMMMTNPFWTPDGKDILFLRRPGQPSDPQPAPTELWRLSVETGKAEKLGLAMQGLRHVTLHPDGKRLAFAAGESKSEIWVMENLLPGPVRAAK